MAILTPTELAEREGLGYKVAPKILDDDGQLTHNAAMVYSGDVGQRLGFTPARDEGFLRETVKGFIRGGAELGRSIANTFDAQSAKAHFDTFLRVNQHLSDSNRKETWSYIGNVAGSQIAQNLPMLAATVAASALTGGGAGAVAIAGRAAKARALAAGLTETAAIAAERQTIRTLATAAIAKKALAAKATVWGSTAVMQWGNNRDEIDERLPNLPTTQKLAMAIGITAFQSFIETGIGAQAQTAKAVSRWGFGNILAREAGLTTVQKAFGKGIFGRLSRFRQSLGGQWIGVGVEETFEELLQQASMDTLVNTLSTDKVWDNDTKWAEMQSKYGQVLREGFIGGMALGIIPVTINALNNMQTQQKVNDLIRPDPKVEDKVDQTPVKTPDGKTFYAVDTAARQKTQAYMAELFPSLGLGETPADISQRTKSQVLFSNFLYKLADMEQKAEPDIEKRKLIRPEKYIQYIRTVITANPQASKQIYEAMTKEGATTADIVNAINNIDPKFKVRVNDVAERYEFNLVKKNLTGLNKEAEGKIASSDDNAVAARAAAEIDILSYQAPNAKSEDTQTRVVDPNVIRAIAQKTGAGFQRIFASGWITDVKIGDNPPIAIRLEMDDTTRQINGLIYDNKEAKTEMDEESKLAEFKAEAIESTAGLITENTDKLARAKLNQQQLLSKLDKWYRYDEISKDMAKPAVLPTIPEEIAENPPEVTEMPLEPTISSPEAQVLGEPTTEAKPPVSAAVTGEEQFSEVGGKPTTVAEQIASGSEPFNVRVDKLKKLNLTDTELGKFIATMKGDEVVTKPSQAPSSDVQKALDKYDNADATVNDVVAELKGVDTSDKVTLAIANYEKALQLDKAEYGQRSGLPEDAGDKLIEILRQESTLPPPAPKTTKEGGIAPITREAGAGALLTYEQAVSQGQRIKIPKGATYVQGTDAEGRNALVSIKDIDTLKGTEWKKIEFGVNGKKGFVAMEVPPAPTVLTEKGTYGGPTGVYVSPINLMGFFKGHDAATIMHELVHHLVENELMPNSIMSTLRDNFVVDVDKNRRLNEAEKENIANSFLSYVVNNRIPANQEIAKAFVNMKRIIAYSIKKNQRDLTAMVMEEGKAVTGTAEIGLTEDTRKMFQSLFSDVTEDDIARIYGTALKESLLNGDVSQHYQINLDETRGIINELAGMDNQSADTTAKSLVTLYGDNFGNKTDLSKLHPNELYTLHRLLLDELQMRDPTRGEPSSQKASLHWESRPAVLEERKPPNIEKMPRKKLNSYIVSKLFDGDVTAARAAADEMFGKDSISSLTDKEARKLAETVFNEMENISEAKKVEIPPETEQLANELSGAYINELENTSLPEKWRRTLVMAGRKVMKYIPDLRTATDWISNFAPGWRQYFTVPFTNMGNDAQRNMNNFYEEYSEELSNRKIDDTVIYDSQLVGKYNITKSTMLDIYFRSNYGTELDNTDMQKFREGNPEFDDDKMLAQIIQAVKDDGNLVKLGDLMQEMNDKYFDKSADVKEAITGKRPKKIKRSYTTELTEEGLFIETDMTDLSKQLEINTAQGKVSMEPSEFKHRGDLPTGRYNTDAYDKFFGHIHRLVNYAAKAQPTFRMLSTLENETMRNAFLNTFGEDSYRQTTIKLLKREMSSTGTLRSVAGAPLEKFISRLTNKAYTTFLSWNPMPMVTQATTVLPAISALGVGATPKLVSNIATFLRQAVQANVKDTDAYKLVDQLSPSVFHELWPAADKQRVQNILEYGRAAQSGLRLGPGLGKARKMYIKYEQLGMRPMASSDLVVRLATYQTAYEIKLQELRYSAMNPEQKNNIAKQFAEDVIRKSHNPASKSERGILQSEGSAFARSALIFTSQPFTIMKMFLTDVYLPVLAAYQKSGLLGVGREVVRNKALWRKIAFGALLPGLALGTIARRRPQKNLKEVLYDAFVMGIGNTVPVIGQALWFTAVLGYGGAENYSGIYGQLVSNINDTISRLIKGKADFRTVQAARRTATLLAGVPEWPFRVTERLFDNIVIDGGDLNGKTLREALIGKVSPLPKD